MHGARREGVGNACIYNILLKSNIMEQILWLIKLLCTSLIKQSSLGANTAAGVIPTRS